MHRHPDHSSGIAKNPVALGEGRGHVSQSLSVGLVAGPAGHLILIATLAVRAEQILVLFHPIGFLVLVGLYGPGRVALIEQNGGV